MRMKDVITRMRGDYDHERQCEVRSQIFSTPWRKYPFVPLAKLALDRRQQEGGSHYC